jgi:hypothetical protein
MVYLRGETGKSLTQSRNSPPVTESEGCFYMFHWDRFFSEYCRFSLSVSLHQCSILVGYSAAADTIQC